VKILKYFFSYAILKMDRFLLNSNKRCEIENKEGTSSTSGKSVKRRKNRKYDCYFDFGFTSTEVDGEERPQCVLCTKVLASECMLPNKLKRHLEITHPSVVSKSRDYFSRKLKELNQQKGSFISRHQNQAMNTRTADGMHFYCHVLYIHNLHYAELEAVLSILLVGG
jgi:hypothetical protein